jgi:hypothetical protein
VFGVVIPVGPGERELSRLAALVQELDRHEGRSQSALIVVDDGPSPRELGIAWPHLVVVRTALRDGGDPDRLSAHVAGTLESFAAARDRGLEFVLKLDTDAAVIGRFSDTLHAAFSDPSLGVVGSYDRTSTDTIRDWSVWRGRIDEADRALALRRLDGKLRVRRLRRAERDHVRAQRRAAYAHAPAGAHCLGGGYAVSGAFLTRAALAWRPWIGSGLGEDVVVGLLASAAGLQMRSLTGRGEPFALAWQGLPAAPEQLIGDGHSIVHSVKCESPERESALRDQLQSLARGRTRTSAGDGGSAGGHSEP